MVISTAGIQRILPGNDVCGAEGFEMMHSSGVSGSESKAKFSNSILSNCCINSLLVAFPNRIILKLSRASVNLFRNLFFLAVVSNVRVIAFSTAPKSLNYGIELRKK